MLDELKDFQVGHFDLVYLEILKYIGDVPAYLNILGTISKENGYGSILLKPNNPIFTFLSVHVEDQKLKSIQFSGDFQFTIEDLMVNNICEERYSYYDNLYFYYFKKAEDYPFQLSVSLPAKIESQIKEKVRQIKMELLD